MMPFEMALQIECFCHWFGSANISIFFKLTEKFIFDFLERAKNFGFLPFALIISSDQWQSKAQFNLRGK